MQIKILILIGNFNSQKQANSKSSLFANRFMQAMRKLCCDLFSNFAMVTERKLKLGRQHINNCYGNECLRHLKIKVRYNINKEYILLLESFTIVDCNPLSTSPQSCLTFVKCLFPSSDVKTMWDLWHFEVMHILARATQQPVMRAKYQET